MKCYKDVMLKKMLEKKWRPVELSINYVQSELLGPRGAFLATGYILLVFYAERIQGAPTCYSPFFDVGVVQ